MFFVFSYLFSVAQDQNIADSLKLLINGVELNDSLYKLYLHGIAVNENNPDSVEYFADILIEQALIDSHYTYISNGYLQKGNAQRVKGNLDKALEYLFNSLEYSENNIKRGMLLGSIADVYSVSGNEKNAILYYDRSIETLRETSDTISLATALYNKADELLIQGRYKEALDQLNETNRIFSLLKDDLGIAYSLGNQGVAYAGLNNPKKAENKLNESIAMLEEMEDYYSISAFLTYLAELYLDKYDMKNALAYAKRSLVLSEKYGMKEQIRDANLLLSEIHGHFGNGDLALSYYKSYVAYRDSLVNIETVEELANMRTEFEVSEKQLEVDLLEQQRKNQRLTLLGTIAGLVALILLAIGLYRRNKFISETNKIIEKEKQVSDNLLLNILPEETATELKVNGKVQARKYDSVTVLFSDFVGFTAKAESLNPEILVKSIDYYFSKFDEIMDKYDIEKIKTVGDAYLCASGIPDYNPEHAERIIKAAKDMLDFVNDTKAKMSDSYETFDIRIGVNTGPVVAGVVGTRKFAYDIWGDTVNIASRMETSSKPGKINISQNTYREISDKFECEPQNSFVTKNGTQIQMYYVQ